MVSFSETVPGQYNLEGIEMWLNHLLKLIILAAMTLPLGSILVFCQRQSSSARIFKSSIYRKET